MIISLVTNSTFCCWHDRKIFSRFLSACFSSWMALYLALFSSFRKFVWAFDLQTLSQCFASERLGIKVPFGHFGFKHFRAGYFVFGITSIFQMNDSRSGYLIYPDDYSSWCCQFLKTEVVRFVACSRTMWFSFPAILLLQARKCNLRVGAYLRKRIGRLIGPISSIGFPGFSLKQSLNIGSFLKSGVQDRSSCPTSRSSILLASRGSTTPHRAVRHRGIC